MVEFQSGSILLNGGFTQHTILSDPRNVAHDKKVIHQKQKRGESLAAGSAPTPHPGKKTAYAASHGAHKETEAEEAGGNVTESTE